MLIDGREYISASDVATLDGYDPILLYGQFLDDFYGANDVVREELIKEAPISKDDRPKHYNAMLAAVCESLAKAYNLPIPTWVNYDCYFLVSPTFSFNTKNNEFQKYLLQTTPCEFAKRNIFFGDNVMNRC